MRAAAIAFCLLLACVLIPFADADVVVNPYYATAPEMTWGAASLRAEYDVSFAAEACTVARTTEALVEAVLAEVESLYAVDRSRRYVVGFGAGADAALARAGGWDARRAAVRALRILGPGDACGDLWQAFEDATRAFTHEAPPRNLKTYRAVILFAADPDRAWGEWRCAEIPHCCRQRIRDTRRGWRRSGTAAPIARAGTESSIQPALHSPA